MSSSAIVYILSAATCFIASCCNYDEQFVRLCPIKHQTTVDVISGVNGNVDASVNSSGGCQCTALAEIRCRGLRAIPQFDPIPSTSVDDRPMF